MRLLLRCCSPSERCCFSAELFRTRARTKQKGLQFTKVEMPVPGLFPHRHLPAIFNHKDSKTPKDIFTFVSLWLAVGRPLQCGLGSLRIAVMQRLHVQQRNVKLENRVGWNTSSDS